MTNINKQEVNNEVKSKYDLEKNKENLIKDSENLQTQLKKIESEYDALILKKPQYQAEEKQLLEEQIKLEKDKASIGTDETLDGCTHSPVIQCRLENQNKQKRNKDKKENKEKLEKQATEVKAKLENNKQQLNENDKQAQEKLEAKTSLQKDIAEKKAQFEATITQLDEINRDIENSLDQVDFSSNQDFGNTQQAGLVEEVQVNHDFTHG
jgi:hypothetical protein